MDSWNYYLQKKHCTNNSCEGYNSKLLRLFDYKKPSFWQIIQIILNELQYFTARYYDLIEKNSNPAPDSVSNIYRIHNLCNSNAISLII